MLLRCAFKTRRSFQNLKAFHRRHLSESSNAKENVRVRFAPSPTGHLHLGGLRTALYNYLFARSKNGQFLLRVEDTDQSRLIPGAAEGIIDDLRWAGIEIDEGPGIGGDRGPYVQSERREIYADAVEMLLENGSAYRCFCSERRLELLRKEAARTRQIPRYDNKCRHLSSEQIEKFIKNDAPYCIRFRLSEHLEPINDLIFGPVQHNVAENEGDPVIMKSDKFPTYHLANVVDDHLMGITHVLRGVEWQISTTKHLLLYKAFGWQAPEFGHLPLLVNLDGTKLSKRQNDVNIKYFRGKGYFPEAVINYVVTSGGGFQRELKELEIYSMNELVKQFDIDMVNYHPTQLNPYLLNELNRLKIGKSLSNKDSLAELITQVRTLVSKTYPTEKNLDLSDEHIENILRWSQHRLITINFFVKPQLSFLWVLPTNIVLQCITKEQLEKLYDVLRFSNLNNEELSVVLKKFAESEDIKYPEFMRDVRAVLSGLQVGPGVVEIIVILGREAVLQRIVKAIDNAQWPNDAKKKRETV